MDITMIAIAGLISLIVGTVFGISVRRLQTFRSRSLPDQKQNAFLSRHWKNSEKYFWRRKRNH